MAETETRETRKAAKKEIGRVPSRFWYWFGVSCTRIAGVFLGLRVHIDPAVRKLQGPAILLGNHPSYLDPFLLALISWPLHFNMISQNDLFRNPILRFLLLKLGCIPKVQFRTDTRAVKAMFRVLRRNGMLGVFPEGMRSPDGTGLHFEDAITRTAKKTGSAIVVNVLHGAYLTWPRWATKGACLRFGRIHSDCRVLFTHEQIKAMPTDEIHAGVRAALAFNDYDWQRENHIRFRCRKPANGLQNILHQCPRCGAELAMRSEGHRIWCSACGNEGIMDAYGLLSPKEADDVIPPDPAAWHTLQKESMVKRVANPDFAIECEVPLLKMSDLDGDFSEAGSGRLRVDREGIRYTGTINGEEKSLFVRLARLPGFSSDFGKRFELVIEDVSYRIYTDDGQRIIQILDAVEALRVWDSGENPTDK